LSNWCGHFTKKEKILLLALNGFNENLERSLKVLSTYEVEPIEKKR